MGSWKDMCNILIILWTADQDYRLWRQFIVWFQGHNIFIQKCQWIESVNFTDATFLGEHKRQTVKKVPSGTGGKNFLFPQADVALIFL